MSENNGSIESTVEVDGILFDLNRITKPEYFRVMKAIEKLSDDDYEQSMTLSGQLFEKIVVSWPFAQPITKDGYFNLGLVEASRVDAAFLQMSEIIGKKKSSLSVKPPENSTEESAKSLILDQTSPALPNGNMAG